MPYFIYHVLNFFIVHCHKAFNTEHVLRTARVECGYTEGDCSGGPDVFLTDLLLGEIVDKKGEGGPILVGFSLRGTDADFLRVGYFYDGGKK